MKKILIIEDNLAVSEELALILQLENYDVTEAKNGVEGFAMAKQIKPDIIISDINMAGLDGFKVLKAVRNNHATLNIPFIFLTSKADKDSIKLAAETGADDYLVKPFNPTILLEIIETQLIERTSRIVLNDLNLTEKTEDISKAVN